MVVENSEFWEIDGEQFIRLDITKRKNPQGKELLVAVLWSIRFARLDFIPVDIAKQFESDGELKSFTPKYNKIRYEKYISAELSFGSET